MELRNCQRTADEGIKAFLARYSILDRRAYGMEPFTLERMEDLVRACGKSIERAAVDWIWNPNASTLTTNAHDIRSLQGLKEKIIATFNSLDPFLAAQANTEALTQYDAAQNAKVLTHSELANVTRVDETNPYARLKRS